MFIQYCYPTSMRNTFHVPVSEVLFGVSLFFFNFFIKDYEMGDNRKKDYSDYGGETTGLLSRYTGYNATGFWGRLTAKSIALELGVGESTVRDRKKNRAEIDK